MKGVPALLWPQTRHHFALRYGATLLMVLIAFLVRKGLDPVLHQNPFLLFALPIFLSAMLFDRWAAYLATVVGAVLAGYYFLDPRETFDHLSGKAAPVLVFVVVACAVASVVERLSDAVRKLERSEAEKTVLLEELSHRAKNNLMLVSSMLSLQAGGTAEPEVRSALESAVGRIKVVAQAQERLRASPDHYGRVELAGYLQALCTSLGDMLRDVRPIAVRIQCPRTDVEEALAVALGLIANELVTNSLKYAFPGDTAGSICVTVTRAGHQLKLTVQDDGAGATGNVPNGLGSRIVGLLAAQHGGRLARDAVDKGYCVSVTLPFGG